MYLHNANNCTHGYTIAPPTEEQFNNLFGFLLSPSPDTAQSPLPIAITTANKWRWDPWDAMGKFHIFRDRYERRLPPRHFYRRPHNVRAKDWPELAEVSILRREATFGKPVAEAEKAAAKERLTQQITPSSRYWQDYVDEICRLQPVKKMQGRPPYFFDA